MRCGPAQSCTVGKIGHAGTQTTALPLHALCSDMHVLSLHAGLTLSRMVSTHQCQSHVKGLQVTTATPPGGLQLHTDASPPQAPLSLPTGWGHLTLTRTAPAPESPGQGYSWAGLGKPS